MKRPGPTSKLAYSLFAIASLLCLCQESWGVTLVENGRPAADIVISSDTRVLYRFAADAKKRDDQIWEDSGVELFMDTLHDQTNYYQILVNMNGVVGSNRKSPKDTYPFLDASWIPTIKPAIGKEPNRWTMEFSIPLNQLGITGSITGQTWGANLYRNRKTTKAPGLGAHFKYASGWNAIFDKNPHAPQRFGIIVFSEKERSQ